MGTGQSRRLAKIVSTHATDNGAEVLLNHSFVEWLSSPLLFPTEAVRALKVYKAMASVEAMGRALERALSRLPSDLPLSPAVLRGQLRRIALKHGIAKNDPFGAYFAATPSFLAWRDPSG